LQIAIRGCSIFSGERGHQNGDCGDFAEGNGLFLNYDNQGKQKLDALPETTFSLSGTVYEFIRDGQKGVSECRIKMAEGESTSVRRK
jgi:hypothetical protein